MLAALKGLTPCRLCAQAGHLPWPYPYASLPPEESVHCGHPQNPGYRRQPRYSDAGAGHAAPGQL
jgi:hypothetical protein